MARQQINSNQQKKPFVTSQIGTQTSGAKEFPGFTGYGFSCNSPYTTIVCNMSGVYTIMARQLLSTNANQIYFRITVNGSEVVTSYPPPNTGTRDTLTWCTVSLNAGDSIQVVQSNSVSTAWAGSHSSFTITRIA